MTDLTTIIKLFASLNRAPGVTWTDATKRKAPHKPLLSQPGTTITPAIINNTSFGIA
jgi:hypothetical protein